MFVKINTFLRRAMPYLVVLTIALGIAFGYYNPAGARELKKFILLALFLMIYPMMINLKMEQAVDVAKHPTSALSGLGIQFIAGPILGFILAKLFLSAHPYLFAGVILVSVVPTCAMSPGWTGLSRGNVALVLTILTTGFLIAIGGIPFWSWLLMRQAIPVDPWDMLKKILIIIIVPLIAGLLTRWLIVRVSGERGFQKVSMTFPLIANSGLYLMIFIASSLKAKALVSNPGVLGILLLVWVIFYAAMFFIAYLVGPKVTESYEDSIAFNFGSWLKNLTIATALAVTAFHNALVVIPVATAFIVQIPLASIVVRNAEGLIKVREAPV